MTEAYPLQWPEGRPRVAGCRERSRFKTTAWLAIQGLMNELRLLGASYSVLSSDLKLRRDGLPYADQRAPDDPGVAVYFEWKGRQYCFACDRWELVRENIQAVRLTIEAVRGLDRWGTGEMVEAAFSGFMALPPPGDKWWSVLGVAEDAPPAVAEAAYRALARGGHPDAGGSDAEMARLNRAIEQARAR